MYLIDLHVLRVLKYYSSSPVRGIGRDILMFSASIVVIRVVMAGLAEELPPSVAAPLPGLPGR